MAQRVREQRIPVPAGARSYQPDYDTIDIDTDVVRCSRMRET